MVIERLRCTSPDREKMNTFLKQRIDMEAVYV